MSEEPDKDEKTEDPTGKKLEKSREDGNVAQSQEVKSFAALTGGLILVAFLAPWIMETLTVTIRPFLERPHQFIGMDAETLRDVLAQILLDLLIVLGAPMALFIALALIGAIGQFGLLWAPKKLKPDFKKISPISGAKRLFSPRTVMEAVKSLVKVLVVTVVSYVVIEPRLENPERFMAQDILVTLVELHEILILLLIIVVVLVGGIAAADFAYQKYKHTEDLKMTKQEVKDERKNAEGDPLIKNKIRQLRMQRAMQRMMSKVPTASVVVTNPTHYAVALLYDMETMAAPRLVAKGVDQVAHRIRDVAEENDVPVVENPPLARGLYAAVDLDREIPPEHYKAVAEVIGYVMRLKNKFKRDR